MELRRGQDARGPGARSKVAGDRKSRAERPVDQPPEHAPPTSLGQLGRGDPVGMSENFARQGLIFGERAPLSGRQEHGRTRRLGGGWTEKRGASQQSSGPLRRRPRQRRDVLAKEVAKGDERQAAKGNPQQPQRHGAADDLARLGRQVRRRGRAANAAVHSIAAGELPRSGWANSPWGG